MNMTREDILRELELLPVWRLRSPPAEVTVADMPAPTPDEPLNEAIAEIIQVTTPVTITVAPPALRLLVSEDENWLFLLENSVNNAEEEILLQNMLRAISVKTNIDIANTGIAQIAEYQPKVIIVFGAIAAQSLLSRLLSFEALRLNQHQLQLAKYKSMPVVVTYHPSDLLQYLPSKAKAWDDLRLAMRLVRQT